MTDPNGNQTAYQYNSHGLLTQTTFAVGSSVQASVEDAYLCPCQLAGTNFVWAVWRRLNRGTGRCSFSHRATAA